MERETGSSRGPTQSLSGSRAIETRPEPRPAWGDPPLSLQGLGHSQQHLTTASLGGGVWGGGVGGASCHDRLGLGLDMRNSWGPRHSHLFRFHTVVPEDLQEGEADQMLPSLEAYLPASVRPFPPSGSSPHPQRHRRWAHPSFGSARQPQLL